IAVRANALAAEAKVLRICVLLCLLVQILQTYGRDRIKPLKKFMMQLKSQRNGAAVGMKLVLEKIRRL
ncbi:MAG TPA: hypothetical protein VHT50_27465, partial [Mycobacterium sp.]|nr:hypothetical protein [Mycobacterium sp.]